MSVKKNYLIDKVIQEIQIDLMMGDTDPIWELLKTVDEKVLLAYLPEVEAEQVLVLNG
jgi:hypothetical protein|tara:strand:- start:201 stop:374 length:174 start_codon:yes stop_codon:yes gene_type:complete